MAKPKDLFYPKMCPDDSGLMDVGGLKIPPTSLLTAMLYGFAHHKDWKAQEFYFWEVCGLIWNRDDLPEPMMQPNPWSRRMIRNAIQNKYLAIGGSASSSKSHTMAAFAIVCWLSQPADTLVLVTSTTLREARKRIWGSIITLMSVIDGAPCRIRDSIGSIAYVNADGTLIDKAGISLIAAEKSKTREAVGKFIGIKQKNVIVIGDELSELSEAIVHAGLTNLSKNPNLKMIGMSNPDSRFDAFGVWAEPKDGWDSVDVFTADHWETKWGGRYMRLDGERSPNVLAGETIYPWMPTIEKIEEDAALLGRESRGYMRMVRAIFFDSDENESIYNEQEMINSGAMNKVDWQGRPTVVAGLDPAFTNGGDRTILYFANVGYDRKGSFVIEFDDPHHLNDDATNKAIPRTYQIVKQVKEMCIKRGVRPEDLAVDSTGAGSPFCDVLAGEWDPSFMRVSFGSKASDKRVSANSKLTGAELYMDRVSELWFVGKELMRTKQIRGINSDLAKEMVSRNYEMKKSGNLRVKVEPKTEFKQRMGQSPDLADAAFLALDAARFRLGMVAVDPIEDDGVSTGSAFPRPRRSITNMRQALHNPEAEIPFN